MRYLVCYIKHLLHEAINRDKVTDLVFIVILDSREILFLCIIEVI